MTKKMKHTGGILLYHVDSDNQVWVFLVKENGPRYWERKDGRLWSIPKGRRDKGEKIFKTASREFTEEVGIPLPKNKKSFSRLAHFVKKKEKLTVYVTKLDDKELTYRESNSVIREYPKKSGIFIRFNEVSKARWMRLEKARKVILPRQKKMLKQLNSIVFV